MLWFICPIGLLWNCLPWVKKCWVGDIKLGYLSSIYARQFLFCFCFCFQICQLILSNLLIQRVLEPLLCLGTFFSSTLGFKMSWRAMKHQYPLTACTIWGWLFARSSLLIGWVIFIILQLKKHKNLRNWACNYLIKIGLLWSRLPQAKKPICRSSVL